MIDTPSQDNILIMLSTAQQIANYKVYKHYHCPGRVIALSSPVALKQQWNCGIEELIQQHQGKFIALEHVDTLHVDPLLEAFRASLAPHLDEAASPTTIIWNWTGAQKPHSTALYQLARQTAEADRAAGARRRHHIVYADRVQLIVDGQGHTETLDSVLTADEILCAHNMRTKAEPRPPATAEDLADFLRGGSRRAAAWQPPDYVVRFAELAEKLTADGMVGFDEVKAALTAPVDDRVIHRATAHFLNAPKADGDKFLDTPLAQAAQSAKHRTWLTQALNSAGCRLMVPPAATPPGAPPPRPSGHHFEAVVQRRMLDWHNAHGRQWISEMLFNIHVYHPRWNRNAPEVGEFDCLLITKTGEFHAIDFKSAGKSGDFRRQNATLTLGGGAFASFYYLYPWLDCDLDPITREIRTDRPAHEQARIRGIADMDKELGDRAIRFYTEDADFHRELCKKLKLNS